MPESEDTFSLTEDRLHTHARRVLRRLCEPGAVLAVAGGMDKAVVVRETDSGPNRTAVVDRDIAEAMALKTWISCDTPGRISRYRVTPAGRAELARLMAKMENKATGVSEASEGEDTPATEGARSDPQRRTRYGLTESPLILLARRRDKDGTQFLTDDLVRAGERLREDFEMAQIGPQQDQTWDAFLTKEADATPDDPGHDGMRTARSRVIGALRELGPGLGDVALRCCCHLEGLESAEKTMGWSARSGKIVLRIALQRLKRHYDGLGDAAGLMG